MSSEDKVRPKRSLSQKKGKEKQAVTKKNPDKWVFLMKDELMSTSSEKDKIQDDSQPIFSQLRHPRRKDGSLYLTSSDCKSVYEIYSFKEQYRSWFIGNTVHSGGQIYMTTPVDPVFLVLPYLINASTNKHFMSLDQIVCDEEFPDCNKLLSCSGLDHLSQVADVKDVDEDLKVYRYNTDKTMAWLQAKTEAAADALKEQKIHVNSGGSHSAMFIRSNKTDSASRDDYIEFAFSMISEYLPIELEADLRNHMGIKEKQSIPQKEAVENEPPAKKAKTEEGVLEDYSVQYEFKKEKSKTKMTAAQKKLSKVDKSGMKSISSFFSAKS